MTDPPDPQPSSGAADSKLGLIGLGLLGRSLAERLLAAGFDVLGYDLDEKRRGGLVQLGGHALGSAVEVAASVRRIVLSLPTTEVVELVISEMESSLEPGHVIVDTTTGEPGRTSVTGKRLDERGVKYLDATVSGSSEQARRGEVIVMAGGAKATFDACQDLFQAFAKKSFHVGPWGSGARMKLVSNLVLGINRAALAEGLVFAAASGVDTRTALEILCASPAYSRIMDTKGVKMVEEDFTVQARLSQHLKDVRLILEAAASAGVRLPLSTAHRGLLEAAEAAGCGDLDNSAIIRAYDMARQGDQRSDPR